MMFGPPMGPGFPPGGFHQPPRLPFGATPEETGGEEGNWDSEAGKPEEMDSGGDQGTEEGLRQEGDEVTDVPQPQMGSFPRPLMGPGDWRMRGPAPPLMRGPNMPRPDFMRGPLPPRPLLGENMRPRLRAPPLAHFNMAQNYPPDFGEEEGEEYGEGYEEEYGEDYGEEEYREEGGNDEEEYNEENEEFLYDGIPFYLLLIFIVDTLAL